MEDREAGLQVLYNRIKDARVSLGVKTFKRSPSVPVEKDDLLCVFMLEGVDRIVKRNTRTFAGYPVHRELEVIFEMICLDDFDIRAFYTSFRKIVISSPVLLEGCMVRESRSVGPNGYNTPETIGMQMVLSMTYVDKGI